ncbi:hypothetical protein [Amycolatopsis sp. WGS_07]|uniref:hypothetical protein n=1 Tax=Amycolatopsis sp. WGS_07 TaxID=3076764 RepID=UPI003872C82A
MTVVPCLADQSRHTGQPRQTGALPDPQESAVLVRAHQCGRPGRREDGPERETAQPSGAARVVDLGEAEPRSAVAATGTAAAATTAASTAEAVSNAAKPGTTDEAESADSSCPAEAAESAGPSRSAGSTGLSRPADVADSADLSRFADVAASADPPRPAVAAEPDPSRPADPEPPDSVHPDPEHPTRVRVVVDWDLFTRPPRRVATRDEMLASAHRVLARREHGRHRKPDTREPWASRAADFVVTWAPTIRMALLLLAGTAFLAGLVLMDSPIAGVAVTSVMVAAGVAAWVARPRKSPSHRC